MFANNLSMYLTCKLLSSVAATYLCSSHASPSVSTVVHMCMYMEKLNIHNNDYTYVQEDMSAVIINA